MDVGITGQAAATAYKAQSANRSSKPNSDSKSTSKNEELKRFMNSSKYSGVTKSDTYGSVIGDPKLSDKAAEYYNSLKEKFGDAEFVLVSNDSLEGAEAKAAAMNAGGKTVVLIDAEKIERMANDKDYREKMENTISNGKEQLAQIAEQMKGMKSVAGFGMRVNDDGSTSFFALSRKANDEIHSKAAEKREAKKAEAKKAGKKAERKRQEERIEKRRDEKRTKEKESREKINDDDYDFLEADSVEELMKKVTDREYEFLSNSLRTPEESQLGGSIDFSL